MSIAKDDILKYLPHRDPFLFVDEVLEINEGMDIHAIKRLTGDEDYFKGHFPNNPVMPGVIIIEALAQASGILGFRTMNKTPEEGSIYVFAGVEKELDLEMTSTYIARYSMRNVASGSLNQGQKLIVNLYALQLYSVQIDLNKCVFIQHQ